jgi:uridine kinase
MQANHRRFHLGIFGGSGTGKTTYAMKYMASASAKCVFIYDA